MFKKYDDGVLSMEIETGIYQLSIIFRQLNWKIFEYQISNNSNVDHTSIDVGLFVDPWPARFSCTNKHAYFPYSEIFRCAVFCYFVRTIILILITKTDVDLFK